jgi:hypothetical protein
MEDIVRVIRIIEYVGPRNKIEKQVANSLHGEKDFGNGCKITAVTLGTYPEIILHHLPMEQAEAKKQADKGVL